MSKKSSRRRTPKKRHGSSKWNNRWLIVLLLTGVAVLSLVFLARYEERPEVRWLPTQRTTPPPAKDPDTLVRQEVEAFLASVRLTSKDVRRNLTTVPNRYEVQGDLPLGAALRKLRQRLDKISPAFKVSTTDDSELIISDAGNPRVIIRFLPVEPDSPVGPQVVIIMDDLGRSLYPAEVLLSLSQPVTFSVLPGEAHAPDVAEAGHAAGREIMLHAPMEPQGYPAVNPGDDALLVRFGDDEIRRRFLDFLTRVPHVVGVNNHMGSRFTENQRGMTVVMEVVRDHGLYFVDSLTTGSSKVGEVAEVLAVPNLKRDVFLDNVADVEAIKRQVAKLVNRAKRHGYAVGICHPYPETLEALRQTLPRLKEQGVEVVPVSRLLQRTRG